MEFFPPPPPSLPENVCDASRYGNGATKWGGGGSGGKWDDKFLGFQKLGAGTWMVGWLLGGGNRILSPTLSSSSSSPSSSKLFGVQPSFDSIFSVGGREKDEKEEDGKTIKRGAKRRNEASFSPPLSSFFGS